VYAHKVKLKMNRDKTIELLNALIQLNNARIEGYESASRETYQLDLKDMFEQFVKTSEQCKQELVNEVRNVGGAPAEGIKTSGKFFRVWMDVKSALTSKDRGTILNACEYGEDMTVNAYETVLRDNLFDVSAEQKTLMNDHYILLKADHDTINSMLTTFAVN
jgi:uncharacterized protein (TIGR02284 family)